MFADQSFQSRIEEANKVFVSALEKLKAVQTDICSRPTKNTNQIQKLNVENDGLEKYKIPNEEADCGDWQINRVSYYLNAFNQEEYKVGIEVI